MTRTLGLDLGPNSIGWALIDDNPDNPDDSQIVDLGVRVFPEGVDNFDSSKEKSRNEGRRVARSMRRQIARRSRRRKRLRAALIEKGLWPKDSDAEKALLSLDPYELRAKALDEPLTLHQLGRVILHLNQRRGFKSNKKEQAKADRMAEKKKQNESSKPKEEEKKNTVDLLLEMAELDKAIEESNSRTLGEYLFVKASHLDHKQRTEDDHVRGRHTLRKMLTDEFTLIWEKQSKHHPDVLTHELGYGKLGRQKDIRKPLPKNQEYLDRGLVRNPRYGLSDIEAFGVFGLIFFHRTLKPIPKDIVGLCELEPKERRCARGDRRAQRFRLLQEINNLRFVEPDTNEESALDDEQRTLLLDYLSTREKATFDQIRAKLNFLQSIPFNLEKGKRSSIKGMVTDWEIAKSLGTKWHTWPEETKDGVVDVLVQSIDDEETHEKLTRTWDLSDADADKLLSVELPDGYLNFSLKAIEKLLPHMERGLVYEHRDAEKSARAQAGYDDPWALRRRLFDKLPDPARSRDCPIGDIPNPVVKRALVEMRKVVNAIIRTHGMPSNAVSLS